MANMDASGYGTTKQFPPVGTSMTFTIPAPIHTDPWAHRSQGMRCKTCMWFARKGNGVLGRCRKHAPTLGGFPAVFEAGWCGDHKLDEASLEPAGAVGGAKIG